MTNLINPLSSADNFMGRNYQKVQDSIRSTWNVSLILVAITLGMFSMEFFMIDQHKYDSLTDFSVVYKSDTAAKTFDGLLFVEAKNQGTDRAVGIQNVSSITFFTNSKLFIVVRYLKYLFFLAGWLAVVYQIKLYTNSLAHNKFFTQQLYKSAKRVTLIIRIFMPLVFLYIVFGIDDYITLKCLSSLINVSGGSLVPAHGELKIPGYLFVVFSMSLGEILNIFADLIKNGLELQKETELTV